jgi:hypothetical protein
LLQSIACSIVQIFPQIRAFLTTAFFSKKVKKQMKL